MVFFLNGAEDEEDNGECDAHIEDAIHESAEPLSIRHESNAGMFGKDGVITYLKYLSCNLKCQLSFKVGCLSMFLSPRTEWHSAAWSKIKEETKDYSTQEVRSSLILIYHITSSAIVRRVSHNSENGISQS